MSTAGGIKSTTGITLKNHKKTAFMILLTIVSMAIIAPLAIIDTPLLADYPNHLARIHIIGNVDYNAILAERYEIRFEFIPNIIMDLWVPWVAQVVPLDLAGRMFLVLCLISPLLSVAYLHHTLFNQWSLSPLLAAMLAYHGSMIAGMANFSLAIGLVPAALAVWIRLDQTTPLRRLLIGSALALTLFLCHLVAFAAYGLLVLGWEIAGLRDRVRAADGQGWYGKNGHQALRQAAASFGIAGATGLLPLALLFRLVLGDREAADASTVVFGNLAWKLKTLLSPLANYNLPLDLTSFALLSALGLMAWWSGWVKIDRRMMPGLALLAGACLLAPKALWTGGVLDQRLTILFCLMLIACARLRLPKGPPRLILPSLLALLFLVRLGMLATNWVEHRADLEEMRRAIQLVPPGSRILVARPDKSSAYELAPPRHWVFHHAVQLASLPTLAVIEKSAFVSTLYALPGQQPLVLKPPFDRLGGRGHVDLPTLQALRHAHRSPSSKAPGKSGVEAQIRDWTRDFDHLVLIYGYGPGAAELAGDLPLEPLLDGDILDLFRIKPGS